MKAKPYLRTLTLKEGYPPSEYPFSIPAVGRLGRVEFHEDVTFFIGENGAGKSTLLEAIAIATGLGREGGNRNVSFESADTVSRLHEFVKLVRSFEKPAESYFLRAESFYNVATYMDQLARQELEERGIPIETTLRSYGGKSLHQQSHGESFMRVLLHKLRGKGLYLLDEPEAALSPTRQLAAIARIHQLILQQSQFIIVTHSPIILAYPRAKIIELDERGWHEVEYEHTDHFAVTRSFLNNYKHQLDRLFSED